MKDMSKPFILNCEVFLQCHGHCSGCFLTEIERAEENTYLDKVELPILELLAQNKDSFSHYVIGFGRGNLLSMSEQSLNKLLELMKKCEDVISKELITYEVSTSLIGKLDKQIDVAHYLLSNNKSIYFNVVINSEITSRKFWENWDAFYSSNVKVRESWGLTDYTGDILVLNVNPRILPDISLIENYFANKPSPINISLFPFDGGLVSQEELNNLNNWSREMFQRLSHLDLNVHNYMEAFKSINIGYSLEETLGYHNKTVGSYLFVDKDGLIVSGASSIMGEVDYVRLLNKYSTDIEPSKAIIKMQKNKTCVDCEHQQKCLLTGAYLNMMHNSKRAVGVKGCLSGYQGIFDIVG